ncbi:MAG: FG-GAP-like repeat-containing protein [Balneolales bacterium]
MVSCSSDEEVPDPSSDKYAEAVSAFYLSLAASQTDEAMFAFTKMNEVAGLYPEEPAAWANLGVYAMRQGNFELASDRLEKAREWAPDNGDILFLSGLLESRRGEVEQSIAFLRRAADADPQNVKIKYTLATELERQDASAHAAEILELSEQIHALRPHNQVMHLEIMRLAAREGDPRLAGEYAGLFARSAGELPADAREQLTAIQQDIARGEVTDLATELAFLINAMSSQPEFQAHLSEVRLPASDIGFVLSEFLWLPPATANSAPPDTSLRFEERVPYPFSGQPSTVTSVVLSGDVPPQVISLSDIRATVDAAVELPLPGGDGSEWAPNSLALLDYDYDFLNDLIFAGKAGLLLYRQNSDTTFTDVTGVMDLPESVTGASYSAVWSADLDMDGDLDLVLAPREGSPLVLRNNGDETFSQWDLFAGADTPAVFLWADLDGDGAPDAVFLDYEGNLHFYINERTGGMTKMAHLPLQDDIAAITVADINADSQFDIVALKQDFSLHRLYYTPASGGWSVGELVSLPGGAEDLGIGTTQIFTPDLDNNGRLDLLVTNPESSRFWLGDASGEYGFMHTDLPGGITSVLDLNGNERLDLLGISENQPYQLMNSGAKNYGARSIRARASGTTGDRRINSFGIGGEMEIRSGLLYQKQLITSPIMHFGLGNYDEAEMLRIIWPNGSVQTEFAELGMGSSIFNEQILKGSCPWLFTHNGEEMQFVTDILWRSPLGLRINARETAGVIQTGDRVKISGDRLVAADGYYDVRITAELWETHFFDYISLIAVDHPAETEIFIDERFAIPSPDLDTRLTGKPQPVAGVWDDQGNDVAEVVREIDGQYLSSFVKTRYQGLVGDHYIEVDLGEAPPHEGPLWLLASGWVKPTDSSINLALSQGEHQPPAGIRVEVPDGKGSWKTVHADMGFPAGKEKTIMLDLTDTFPDGNDRRVRLGTTTEIYWDAIRWARGLDDSGFSERVLKPGKMDLVYRGYSEWNRADSVSPKLPDYGVISGTVPRWRDLVGHYTRFGDVSPLLEQIDDRYVIMNAGDELRLHFMEADSPAEGMTRSFVFVSDGWVKDGDYNTSFSKTVLPLPSHGDPSYDTAPGRLSDDPVFKRHQQDWINYHTRFLTSEPVRSALRFDPSGEKTELIYMDSD